MGIPWERGIPFPSRSVVTTVDGMHLPSLPSPPGAVNIDCYCCNCCWCILMLGPLVSVWLTRFVQRVEGALRRSMVSSQVLAIRTRTLEASSVSGTSACLPATVSWSPSGTDHSTLTLLVSSHLISSQPSDSECAAKRPGSPWLRPVRHDNATYTSF